jgi:hypothetical protein
MSHQTPRCLVRGSLSQPMYAPSTLRPTEIEKTPQTSMNSSMVRPRPTNSSLDVRVSSEETDVIV